MQELFLKTVEKTFTKKSTKARRRKRGWFTQDQMAKKLMWSKLLSCSQALILPNSYSESLSGSLWFSCFFSLSLSLSRSLSQSLSLPPSLSLVISRGSMPFMQSMHRPLSLSFYLSLSHLSLSLSPSIYIYLSICIVGCVGLNLLYADSIMCQHTYIYIYTCICICLYTYSCAR